MKKGPMRVDVKSELGIQSRCMSARWGTWVQKIERGGRRRGRKVWREGKKERYGGKGEREKRKEHRERGVFSTPLHVSLTNHSVSLSLSLSL